MMVLLQPVLTMLLGGGLVVADFMEQHAPASVRFPAMIAALLLIGQSFIDFRLAGEVTAVPDDPQVSVGTAVAVIDPESQQPIVATGQATVSETKPNVERPGAVFVIVLCIWLGWTSMSNTNISMGLSILSLLAACLLFADSMRKLAGEP